MGINRYPRVRRQYTVVGHSANQVEFRSGVWNPTSFTITDETASGRLFRIVSRLDGSASPAQLARDEGIGRRDVEAVVDHLNDLDLLETGASSALDSYLDGLLLSPENAAQPERPLVVIGDDDISERICEELRRSLPEAEIEVADAAAMRILLAGADAWLQDGLALQQRALELEKWRDSLILLAESTISPMRATALNRLCLELEIPWLYAALDGPFLFIGPLTVPRQSSCWECFERRVTMNLRERESYLRYKRALVEGEVVGASMPAMPVLGSMLAAHSVFEALNFVLTGSTFTIGKVLSIYVPTMEFAFSDVLRLPGCAGCGTLSERDESELYFDMRTLLPQAT
jgi:bacteriocin biosynthesis cyclodehydratase domain-containing protein